ncbi:MAG: T9SS type A sorting domain-containing protein, partial [Flavobacterium sp.]|jgi:hypothetical protein
MKKITLTKNFKKLVILSICFLCSLSFYAQNDYYPTITGLGTSQNGRAPQGGRNVTRSIWLITATEMAAAGFTNGMQISGIGFTYQAGQDVTTTGNAIFYMQNTANTTNSKSTTWATAISGMTTVSNASITIPNAAGEFDYSFSGGSAFTYTGGGLYIAFDYQNLSNPVSSMNTAYCNTALTNGLKGAMSAAGSSTPPTTTTSSSFRPETRLGIPVSCARPTSVKYVEGGNTLTSATLSWNPSGGSNVDFEYGLYGYTQGSGINSFTNVSSPYVLNSLSANTVYDFYVRTNCGAGYSTWNGPYAFATQFDAANVPYNTSYEHEILPFIGWTTPNVVPIAGDWAIGYYGPGALVQDGSSSVVSITPAAVAANNWMFSRGINLVAGEQATITYYLSNYQSGTTATGNYQLTVGNAQNSAAQTTILANETGVSVAAFTLKTYNFTPSSTGVYYFGLRNYTPANAAGTHAVIVDNFTVDQLLSSNSFTESSFRVYPNPVNDILTIVNELSSNSKLTIVDINGRIVKQVSSSTSLTSINVSDLNSGIYFVNIETEEGKSTKKIIKN